MSDLGFCYSTRFPRSRTALVRHLSACSFPHRRRRAYRTPAVAAQCRLDEQQLAALDAVLDAGPLAAGWEDQRWTLARVRDLVAAKFKVQYTVPGIWYLLQRRGWTCQLGARRAIERDDGAVEVWKKETWPRIKARRRPSAAGSSSKTSPASR